MKTNNKQFSKGIMNYYGAMQRSSSPQQLIFIGKDECGKDIYLRPDTLKTHVMIQAPTGGGKTFLVRHIFRSLVQQQATIFVDDPKEELFDALEEDCASLKLADRTVLFDTRHGRKLVAFNPLRRNVLSVEDHATWSLAGVKASWGQEVFDQTPQLARWLYNGLALTIEQQGTFLDTLDVLNFDDAATRRSFVSKTAYRLLRQEWEAYESLSNARRSEITNSAIARLHRFCQSPIIRAIVGQRHTSLDLGEILREGKILLTCLARYKPLEAELVDLLRSLLLQLLLANAFHYGCKAGERPPLYIILDEAEHILARDTGIIETILNEGRSLGIHLILIFHTFAQVGKKNPNLLASVLSNCRTKIIGGGIPQSDLKILTEELFITQWNSRIIKDEIEALELEPVETTRTQVSYSQGEQESEELSLGAALQEAVTKSRNSGISFGIGRGRQINLGRGRSRGSTHTTSISEGRSYGSSSNWQTTTTEIPFYEYEKRMRVIRKEFLSLEEFLTEKLIRLKLQPTGHWAVKSPKGGPIFFRAVLVKPLIENVKQRAKALNEFREIIYSRAYHVDPGRENLQSKPEPACTEIEARVVAEYEDEEFFAE